jgi:hypothetical protein
MSPAAQQSPVPRLKELGVDDSVRIWDVKYRVTDVEHRNHHIQLELAASDGGHATLIGVPGARVPSGTGKGKGVRGLPVNESNHRPPEPGAPPALGFRESRAHLSQ